MTPDPSAAPLISVLMPAYNCGPFLAAAIDSVRAQTWPNWELLIVDDGSTDDTPQILGLIDDPRIRIWRRANAGKPAALNFMLAEARGRWFALQDADDLSAPERLARMAERLAARPHLAAALSGHWLLIDDRPVAPRAEAKSPERCRQAVAALGLPAHDPTLVCDTEVGRTLGFAEDLRIVEGVDFLFRLIETRDVEVVGAPLYHYRVNLQSLTRSNVDRRNAAVRSALDRARARRGLPPFDDAGFAAHMGPVMTDPTNNILGHFTDSAYLQLVAGDRRGALATALLALRAAPLSLRSLKPLIYALSPRPIARAIRQRR